MSHAMWCTCLWGADVCNPPRLAAEGDGRARGGKQGVHGSLFGKTRGKKAHINYVQPYFNTSITCSHNSNDVWVTLGFKLLLFWICDVFWLGRPAPQVPGSDSKPHLESRCCAMLIHMQCYGWLASATWGSNPRPSGILHRIMRRHAQRVKGYDATTESTPQRNPAPHCLVCTNLSVGAPKN